MLQAAIWVDNNVPLIFCIFIVCFHLLFFSIYILYFFNYFNIIIFYLIFYTIFFIFLFTFVIEIVFFYLELKAFDVDNHLLLLVIDK